MSDWNEVSWSNADHMKGNLCRRDVIRGGRGLSHLDEDDKERLLLTNYLMPFFWLGFLFLFLFHFNVFDVRQYVVTNKRME